MKTHLRARRWSGALLPDERGGAIVETAIILPVLILLVVGIAELGIAWHRYHIITDAAREGARRGAVVASTQAEVTNAVNNHLTQNGLNPALAGLNIAPTNWPVPTGQPVTVAVSYPITFGVLSRLVAGITGSQTITTTITMRRE